MANQKIELSVKTTEIDKVKNFIQLVEIYYNDLPEELKKSIDDIEEQGLSDFTSNDLNRYMSCHDNLSHNDVKVFIDTKDNKQIISANKILKRVLLGDGTYCYPESFKILIKDKVLFEW